jgi:class 3 adenylate cyclase
MIPDPASVDTTAHQVVAIVAIGMGLAFYLADRSAPTSRSLSLFLIGTGLAIVFNVVLRVGYTPDSLPSWARFVAVFETIAFIAGFEWGIRVGRTVPRAAEDKRRGEWLVRLAQGLVLVYCGLSIALPEARARYFLSQSASPDLYSRDFYLFAAPLALAGLLVMFAALYLLRDRPDRPERIRIRALLFAMPFLASGLVLPVRSGALGMVIGEVIFLIGAVQYHVMQGQRGQFLSRFLSPQVANLVHQRGLRNAMQTSRIEISIVCCDIRGFTAYAQGATPDRVIAVLRDYYAVVGEVVARFGGTIKDQAGDGILVLVGAPIPYADHARRAVDMAREVRERGREVTARWSNPQMQLGLGVGVASGVVAVGVIGNAARLEYTAVGPAVNLAARLCARAEDGEIRLAQRTMELCGGLDDARSGTPVVLKGFAEPVAYFVLG